MVRTTDWLGSLSADRLLASTLVVTMEAIMAYRFALALAMAWAAGSACAEEWQFSYTGFNEDGVFRPDERLTGSFRGADVDLDGKISLPELSSLVIDGRQYLDGCLSLSDPYFRCEIDAFQSRRIACK